MEDVDKARLLACRTSLRDNVKFREISTHLLQESVITADDYQRIQSAVTDADKMLALLDILPSKGVNAYNCFVDSLREHYDWIVDEIQGLEASFLEEKYLNKNNRPRWRDEEISSKALTILKDCARLLIGWPRLARRLNMSQFIGPIRIQANIYCEDQSDCIIRLVEQWQGLVGRKKATVGHLVDALRAEHFNECADDLMDLMY